MEAGSGAGWTIEQEPRRFGQSSTLRAQAPAAAAASGKNRGRRRRTRTCHHAVVIQPEKIEDLIKNGRRISTVFKALDRDCRFQFVIPRGMPVEPAADSPLQQPAVVRSSAEN